MGSFRSTSALLLLSLLTLHLLASAAPIKPRRHVSSPTTVGQKEARESGLFGAQKDSALSFVTANTLIKLRLCRASLNRLRCGDMGELEGSTFLGQLDYRSVVFERLPDRFFTCASFMRVSYVLARACPSSLANCSLITCLSTVGEQGSEDSVLPSSAPSSTPATSTRAATAKVFVPVPVPFWSRGGEDEHPVAEGEDDDDDDDDDEDQEPDHGTTAPTLPSTSTPPPTASTSTSSSSSTSPTSVLSASSSALPHTTSSSPPTAAPAKPSRAGRRKGDPRAVMSIKDGSGTGSSTVASSTHTQRTAAPAASSSGPDAFWVLQVVGITLSVLLSLLSLLLYYRSDEGHQLRICCGAKFRRAKDAAWLWALKKFYFHCYKRDVREAADALVGSPTVIYNDLRLLNDSSPHTLSRQDVFRMVVYEEKQACQEREVEEMRRQRDEQAEEWRRASEAYTAPRPLISVGTTAGTSGLNSSPVPQGCCSAHQETRLGLIKLGESSAAGRKHMTIEEFLGDDYSELASEEEYPSPPGEAATTVVPAWRWVDLLNPLVWARWFVNAAFA